MYSNHISLWNTVSYLNIQASYIPKLRNKIALKNFLKQFFILNSGQKLKCTFTEQISKEKLKRVTWYSRQYLLFPHHNLHSWHLFRTRLCSAQCLSDHWVPNLWANALLKVSAIEHWPPRSYSKHLPEVSVHLTQCCKQMWSTEFHFSARLHKK